MASISFWVQNLPVTDDSLSGYASNFTYPKAAFDTAASITKLAAQLETTFVGAYLGAAGGMQATSLVGGIASIGANQAQHLSVFQNMLFRRPINISFPKALSIQDASNAMDAFAA